MIKLLKNSLLCLTTTLFFFSSNISLGQITSAGKDFWFGFTEVYDTTNVFFLVYISSPINSTGTISIPGQAFSQNFTVSPGAITSITLPAAAVHDTSSEILESKAVHITSNNDVVVYAHTYHVFRADASLILPVPALGNEYYVASYNDTSSGYPSEFMVIGSGTAVTIEITPSAATVGGRLANVPFNVTINSGEIYQVQSDTGDLTGSRVRSLNANDKFSVIGGSKFTDIPFNCSGTNDPTYEQLFPVSTWGKNYIFLPTPLLNDDACRVIASQNGTNVTINGSSVATLNAGQFYETSITAASLISANLPISVARYLKSSTCVAIPVKDANSALYLGDPAQVMIDANEQMFLDNITFYASANMDIDSNYLQIVTRTADVNTIILDGTNIGSGFTPLAADPVYSYRHMYVETGAHTLESTNCGFLAYITGLGGGESYAYSAGVALPKSSCTTNINSTTLNIHTITNGSVLEVFFPVKISGSMSLIDFSGRTVLTQKLEHQNQITLNVSHHKGLFLLRVDGSFPVVQKVFLK